MKRCSCRVSKTVKSFKESQLTELSNNLQMVSAKSRLELMFLLKDKPHCVCDLSEHTTMSQSLVSHHLSDLSRLSYVESKRSGKFIDYLLTKKGKRIVEVLKLLIK